MLPYKCTYTYTNFYFFRLWIRERKTCVTKSGCFLPETDPAQFNKMIYFCRKPEIFKIFFNNKFQKSLVYVLMSFIMIFHFDKNIL